MKFLIGIAGIAVILLIALALSSDRRAIRLRVVGAAFALQAAIAVLVLYVPWGRSALSVASAGVGNLLGYANAGTSFLFGRLAEDPLGKNFAIQALPVIIFFAALVSILYYIGLMQLIVRFVGGAIEAVIGVSKVESLCAAANIFVGQSESPLVIRPYLAALTPPQLFTVMTSGMAGVAGTILAAYASMGIRIEYLLAASFMAAPGGILMGKDHHARRGGPAGRAPARRSSRGKYPPLRNADQRTGTGSRAPGSTPGDRDDASEPMTRSGPRTSSWPLRRVRRRACGWRWRSARWCSRSWRWWRWRTGCSPGSAAGSGLRGSASNGCWATVFAPDHVPPQRAVERDGQIGGRPVRAEDRAQRIRRCTSRLGTAKAPRLSPHTVAVVTFALCGFANFSSIAIQMAVTGARAEPASDDRQARAEGTGGRESGEFDVGGAGGVVDRVNPPTVRFERSRETPRSIWCLFLDFARNERRGDPALPPSPRP